MPNYNCIQYGICPLANACEKIEIKPGEIFQCMKGDAKCRENLVEIRGGGMSRGLRRILVLAPVVIAVIALVWWFAGSGGGGKSTAATGAASVEDMLADVWPWLK